MAGRIPLSTPDKRGSHIVYWIAVAVLAGVGVALFVLPHHKGDSGFGSLARDFGEILTSEPDNPPGAIVIQGLVAIGALAVFMPGILGIAIALTSPPSRKVLIACGVLLIVGAILTFFVEIVSNMAIGWGSGSKYPETGVAYLAPLFPLLCGIASIVMGAMRVRLP
jgi:uncharacterized membrane protein YhaH (DUF805 family)